MEFLVQMQFDMLVPASEYFEWLEVIENAVIQYRKLQSAVMTPSSPPTEESVLGEAKVSKKRVFVLNSHNIQSSLMY